MRFLPFTVSIFLFVNLCYVAYLCRAWPGRHSDLWEAQCFGQVLAYGRHSGNGDMVGCFYELEEEIAIDLLLRSA
jgi:hypothetical protein